MASLPDDLVGLVVAHLALKERVRVCMAVSKAFREATQRRGGILSLHRSSSPRLVTQWAQDSVTIRCSGQSGNPLPSMQPTRVCLTGFDASDQLLRAVLCVHGVTSLEVINCTGRAVAWHAALMHLRGACTSLEWHCPAVPVEVAVSSIASMSALEHLHIHVCLMPQYHPYTEAQLQNALLAVGALAAIPTLRDVTLLEGPRDGEGGSDKVLFGYNAPYQKKELDCDDNVITGLALAFSKLHQVRCIETDMLGDWEGEDTATAFGLMLAALPGLQELGTIFFLTGATWDRIGAHLPPAGHPSLRCLRLRFSDPDEEDLRSMAQAVGTSRLFPELRQLELELFDARLDAHEAARQLDGLRGLRSLETLLIDWDEVVGPGSSREALEQIFGGLAHSVRITDL